VPGGIEIEQVASDEVEGGVRAGQLVRSSGLVVVGAANYGTRHQIDQQRRAGQRDDLGRDGVGARALRTGRGDGQHRLPLLLLDHRLLELVREMLDRAALQQVSRVQPPAVLRRTRSAAASFKHMQLATCTHNMLGYVTHGVVWNCDFSSWLKRYNFRALWVLLRYIFLLATSK
jgi:hypothetical protein